ncbi:MAG TPA: ABC transporter ATP-binding protein [Candidatus Deferrimicrobium sp.]|nr:ABC transporter ATP-binding protein [Candidatus Deferrimicrobium sp.]
MQPVIEVQNFSFKYANLDYAIIHNVSFSIEKEDVVLIFGPSGSGKSTLCYSLVGLIPWSIKGMFKGKINVLGQNLTTITPRELAGSVGLVMQNPDNQFINLTVFDELIFGAENLKIPEDKIRRRLGRVTELLELTSLLNRNLLQLSGGEKQRVILGSVLMMKPEILILDEPLAFLDAQGRLELLHHLSNVKKKFGPELTILIAEHRINEILPLANKFISVDKGKVELYSDLNSIKTSYFQEIPHLDRSDKIAQQFSTTTKSPMFSYDEMIKKYSFIPEKEVDSKNPKEALEPLIYFDEITFNYVQDQGKYERLIRQIFNKISFKIYPGEIIGVVGPNGSGKTTLLYLIAGVLKPNEGRILCKGKDLKDIPYHEYAKTIGLIFQNPESQLLKNTILKELEFGPKNFNILNLLTEDFKKELISLVFSSQEEILKESLNQRSLMDLNPFNLSWGQKRRLNLASLYAYFPSLYLLDEPFTGQDFRVRREIISTLLEILGKNKSAVISSHDEEILSVCSKVFLIEGNHFEIYVKKEK